MVDEQKNTTGDDEYQFPQEEYAGEEQSPEGAAEPEVAGAGSESASSRGDGFRKKVIEGYTKTVSARNKRIIIIVLALIGILLLPKLIGIFHTEPKKSGEPVVSKPVQQPAPVSVEQPVVSQPDQLAIVPSVDPSLDEARAYRAQADSKVQELQNQVATIQNGLAQSESTNEQLQKSVSQLTSQVEALSTQLKRLMMQEKKEPKSKTVNFYLRAVVPDRAWVMTGSGETVSVSVGDSLDQYGTIQSIDPVYGVIQTSSGRKITYGSNDY
ncbi:MAG: hypothetical protein Q8L78_03370 [Coxiellaceae bacterium]|nr:hypothetical protein [Coxiellaceae bacterium]